jgi:hypothetical protein
MFATQPWDGLAQLDPACGPAGICPPPTEPPPPPPTAATLPPAPVSDQAVRSDGRIDDEEWLIVVALIGDEVLFMPARSDLTLLGRSVCDLARTMTNASDFELGIAIAASGSGLDVEDATMMAGSAAFVMCQDELERLGYQIG